jgi:hypothetical protein
MTVYNRIKSLKAKERLSGEIEKVLSPNTNN